MRYQRAWVSDEEKRKIGDRRRKRERLERQNKRGGRAESDINGSDQKTKKERRYSKREKGKEESYINGSDKKTKKERRYSKREKGREYKERRERR